MSGPLVSPRGTQPLAGAVQRILEIQTDAGAIPWFENGPFDPWNHGESVMALGVAGEHDAARAGFEYLAATQEADGTWAAQYGNTLPMLDRLRMSRVEVPKIRDTNFTAYCATVLWHHYQLHRDEAFVRAYWPMVRSAIEFVLAYQHDDGDISFSKDERHTEKDDALVTGNASIYGSLRCAQHLALLLNDPQPHWELARRRIGVALNTKPHRFDRVQDRSDNAMDWYYPVLTSAVNAEDARARLAAGAMKFVRPGIGCRCVASQPWVTVAESAELAMAVLGLGGRRYAAAILGWQDAIKDEDGAFWMGWHFEEDIPWPLEKPSWTQAAMILATDALTRDSASWRVLCAREGA